MIHIQHLRKSFGRRGVLHDLSMCARSRDVTLLVGPNGAGKSTTMKILAGLIRPDEGVALIGGRDLRTERIAAQQLLSYLPQNPSFHPRFTPRQILSFYARLRGVGPARIERVIVLAGLTDVADQRAGALSGGTRQRVGIALLFLADSPVLLLDEPGLSLDPGWRWRLQNLLQAEARRGKTVLVTTHLIGEWNGIADRCLLCVEGRITTELNPDHLPSDFGEVDGTDIGVNARITSCASQRTSASVENFA
jgi:ABC-type multidrug transport system ATPase subunit